MNFDLPPEVATDPEQPKDKNFAWVEARRLYGESAAQLEHFAEKYPTLYHGTDKVGAEEILKTNAVGEMQLSFTPDYSMAKGYAEAKGGIVVSVKTKDIDPGWLEQALESWRRLQQLDENKEVYQEDINIVIQVGGEILGHEPRIIKAEIVQDKKEV